MNAMKAIVIVLGFVLALPCTSHAQILVAKEGPVVYGHHHLNTTNMDAQKKFFVDTLGGKARQVRHQNNQEIIEFPNVLDLLPADAGADRRHDRHDGESHRLLGARPEAAGREDQGERLQDDHRRTRWRRRSRSRTTSPPRARRRTSRSRSDRKT